MEREIQKKSQLKLVVQQSPSVIDKASREKIIIDKKAYELPNDRNKMTFMHHFTQQQNTEFFSSVNGQLTKINHILGH